MPDIVPVILCGGSGTRLWPLSRETYPKQFVDMGGGKTLFRDTVLRAQRTPGCREPLVVCNEAHRFYVTAELYACDLALGLVEEAQAPHEASLPGGPLCSTQTQSSALMAGAGSAGRGCRHGKILLEPAPRNTAPAVALAAFALREGGADPLMLVLPSDHVIGHEAAFFEGVERAAVLAESGRIVTFGITPTGPETGFGYIEQGERLGDEGFGVSRFVEKPDAASAAAMLATGGYFWNSGMFLMRASVYLAELGRCAPSMYAACRGAWHGHQDDHAFCRPDRAAFLSSPSDSIDYAVMEHTSLAAVVPLAVTWSDLGSWEAFYQIGQQDSSGNVCSGDVLAEGAANCYLKATHRLLTAIGVSDLIVVETQDAVMVAPRDQVQDVKKIVARLQEEQRPECRQHPLVHRPWGSYETLATGGRFQVKRIIVRPGAELSLQMHHHRAEHWVVVSGTAEVTNGDRVELFTENQSTYIPVGSTHRLKNPGVIPLVLIEIQSGTYLGEDDIVRFADDYGRGFQGSDV